MKLQCATAVYCKHSVFAETKVYHQLGTTTRALVNDYFSHFQELSIFHWNYKEGNIFNTKCYVKTLETLINLRAICFRFSVGG